MSLRKENWAILILLILTAACTEDDPFRSDEIFFAPADIDLIEKDEFVSRNDTVEYSCPFIVQIDGEKGDFGMISLAIKEDTTLLDASRIKIGNETVSNPYTLPDIDVDGFLYDIEITPPTEARDEIVYSFEVTDSSGIVGELDIKIQTVGALNPSLTYSGPSEVAIPISGELFVDLEAKSSCIELASISFYKDSALLEPGSVLIGDNPVDENPIILDGSDAKYYSEFFTIGLGVEPSNNVYYAILEDVSGKSDTVTVSVRTGTLTSYQSGKLYNATDEEGRGKGLDLDDGLDAQDLRGMEELLEIQDIGVDTLSSDSISSQVVWLQQFRGINGTVVKRIERGRNGIGEDFEYFDAELREDIADVFDRGVPFEEQDANGNLISGEVSSNDLFVAKRDDMYYIFRVTRINEETFDSFIQLDILR